MDFLHAFTIAMGIYWGFSVLGDSIKAGLVESAKVRAAGNVAASATQAVVQPQDGQPSSSGG